MKYDIVAGIENQNLNELIQQLYQKLYPSVFKQQIEVHKLGIKTVTLDVSEAPTINLTQSKVTLDMLQQASPEPESLQFLASENNTASNNELLEFIEKASFKLKLAKLALSVDIETQENAGIKLIEVSLDGVLNVSTVVEDGKNYLSANIIAANLFANSGFESLQPIIDLLNQVFVPLLVAYFNDQLLKKIKIPSLEFSDVLISMPVPVVQAPYLLAFSSLGGTQPEPEQPFDWSKEGIFIGVDTNLLQTVAGIPFPLGGEESFDWKIIGGRVRAIVKKPEHFKINEDGSISASISAEALATLTVHTPWPLPNFDLGPVATATVTANLIPQVKNNSIYLQPNNVPDFDFDFKFEPLPSWIATILRPLLSGLSAALNLVFGRIIKNIIPAIKVYTLPDIKFDIVGKTINVQIKEVTPNKRGGPNNDKLILKAKVAID